MNLVNLETVQQMFIASLRAESLVEMSMQDEAHRGHREVYRHVDVWLLNNHIQRNIQLQHLFLYYPFILSFTTLFFQFYQQRCFLFILLQHQPSLLAS